MTTADLVDGGVEGIDADRVTTWFSSHVAGSEPPLTFELIAGGRSNLTYRVADAAVASTPCAARRSATSFPPRTTWPASTA